ncbi:MAG: PH domain-containing protein [Gammaproteobacteria bacterium]|nr:PH domain-containing protein [Gammaproteobacteria bacterium]
MNEHDFEPVRGLPRLLPRGEHLIWQGSPSWWLVATRVFRIHWIALYFLVLILWRAIETQRSVGQLGTTLDTCATPLLLAALGLGLIAGIAWLFTATTVFTVTSKRLVLRQGIAVPTTTNLPFASIEAARLRADSRGTGDIALQCVAGQRVSWLLLWPWVRPWHFSHPQPSLRGLSSAAEVGALIGDAMRTNEAQTTAGRATTADTAPAPAAGAVRAAASPCRAVHEPAASSGLVMQP